jgi:hypothetical protein
LGLQTLLDRLLVCCSSIFRAKVHDLVAIDVVRRYERVVLSSSSGCRAIW